jgi:D-xylose transport system ATP-binding protein
LRKHRARFRRSNEPTAALGPQETTQVGALVKQLKSKGIGIFLISHDIRDAFDLADRICVMKNGRVVGTARVAHVTKDEVLGMITADACPARCLAVLRIMARRGRVILSSSR